MIVTQYPQGQYPPGQYPQQPQYPPAGYPPQAGYQQPPPGFSPQPGYPGQQLNYATPAPGPGAVQDIGEIARRQRALMYCLLGYIGLIVLMVMAQTSRGLSPTIAVVI